MNDYNIIGTTGWYRVIVCLVWLISGCAWFCPKPKPVPTPPVQPLEAPECLEMPPPDLMPWTTDGQEQGCPEPYVACLKTEDASALARDYEDLVRYAKRAWELCGKTAPTPQPPP